MDTFIPVAVLIGFGISLFNLILYLRNKQWDNAFKILGVWVAFIVVVLLFAESDWAAQVVIGDISLEAANFWSKVIMGVFLGGSATVVVEFKKAFDNGDSAAKPKLL
jgi:hypothetical protein